MSFPLPWVRTPHPGLLWMLSTWELVPFSDSFHNPGWIIIKQHSHLVLLLALSWAVCDFVSNSLSSARLWLPLEPHCLSFRYTHSCSSCSHSSCLLLDCLCSGWACFMQFSTFLIFSPSFHVRTESVGTRSLLWNPLSPEFHGLQFMPIFLTSRPFTSFISLLGYRFPVNGTWDIA